MAMALSVKLQQEGEVLAIATQEGVEEDLVRDLLLDAMTELGEKTRLPDYLPVIASKRVRASLREARRRGKS